MPDIQPNTALSTMMTERKLGQRELVRAAAAKGIDISQPVLSSALAGKTLIDPANARKLGEFFGVPAVTFRPDLADFAPAAPATALDPIMIRTPLRHLSLSPKNERRHVDDDALMDLAADIRLRGLLQPLIAYPSGGDYLVADGGRRWRALKVLEADGYLADAPGALHGLGIPVRLVADEAEAMVVTIVANLRREQVHFIDRAAAFARLRDELDMGAAQIAVTVNVGERSVQQHLQINDKLPEADKARAIKGEITFRDARDLVQSHKENGRQITAVYVDEAHLIPPAPPEPQDYAQAMAEASHDDEPVSVRLIRLLADYCGVDAATINRATGLVEDLDIPSPPAGLTVSIHLTFGIDLSRNDWEHVGTVGELTRLIIGRMTPGSDGQPCSPPRN